MGGPRHLVWTRFLVRAAMEWRLSSRKRGRRVAVWEEPGWRWWSIQPAAKAEVLWGERWPFPGSAKKVAGAPFMLAR